MIITFRIHEDVEILPTIGVLANALRARGLEIAFAVNREGLERARAFLGTDRHYYRLPEDPDEEIGRLAHLRRHHGHQNLLICVAGATASWLHGLYRAFPFTAYLDTGERTTIHAHLIIDPDLTARDQTDRFAPESRLLLGPKFYPAVGAEGPDTDRDPETVLVAVGEDPNHVGAMLTALSRAGFTGRVVVLCPSESGLFPTLGAHGDRWPGIEPEPVHRSDRTPFPYRDYDLVLTAASRASLGLAGHCFATIALTKDQLARSYALEQLGIAPSFGWHAAGEPDAPTEIVRRMLTDPDHRAKLIAAGGRLIDGEGAARIARAIPQEQTDRK